MEAADFYKHAVLTGLKTEDLHYSPDLIVGYFDFRALRLELEIRLFFLKLTPMVRLETAPIGYTKNRYYRIKYLNFIRNIYTIFRRR